jgi:hypothetical protein
VVRALGTVGYNKYRTYRRGFGQDQKHPSVQNGEAVEDENISHHMAFFISLQLGKLFRVFITKCAFSHP